jgi:iron complex outermembrane receptor protein
MDIEIVNGKIIHQLTHESKARRPLFISNAANMAKNISLHVINNTLRWAGCCFVVGKMMFSKSLFKRSHLAFLCSGFVFINASSHAQTNTNKNSAADYQYSITANRFSPEYDAGVFILDKTDISESGASNIADVIRLVSGARFKDELDGSSNVKIDLSGFGATADKNTLIMLDGVALNYSTLASIPLDIVERIEIMRHGTAVLYGANTTGGVINIITKPNNKNSRFIKWTLGAYGENKRDYAISQTSDDQKASFRISGSQRDTDGYRKNSASAEEGHQFDLTVKATDQTSLRILQSYERLNAKYPDAISLSQFTTDPTFSASNSWSRLFASKSQLSLTQKEDYYQFQLDLAKTHKDNPSSFGTYEYEATQINPRLKLMHDNHTVTIGLDRKLDNIESWFKNEKRQQAYFAQYGLRLNTEWGFELGYRKDKLEQHLESSFPAVTKELEQAPESFNFRLDYQANSTSGYWLTLSKSARFVSVDESTPIPTSSFSYNPDQFEPLKAQRSRDIALGANWLLSKHIIKASVFNYRIENEIALLSVQGSDSAFGGYNVNLPDTRRLGFDISADWYINEQWSLDTRYSWLKAKFANGSMMNGIDLSGQSVPEVSKNVIHLGTKFKPTQETHFNLYGNYQSSQYLTNDWQNRGEKKPSLWIWNVSAQRTYSQKQMEWTFEGGVKNLTNRPYYAAGSVDVNTLAVSVYPAKPREVYMGASLRF